MLSQRLCIIFIKENLLSEYLFYILCSLHINNYCNIKSYFFNIKSGKNERTYFFGLIFSIILNILLRIITLETVNNILQKKDNFEKLVK